MQGWALSAKVRLMWAPPTIYQARQNGSTFSTRRALLLEAQDAPSVLGSHS